LDIGPVDDRVWQKTLGDIRDEVAILVGVKESSRDHYNPSEKKSAKKD
jgi:hypothetical protein